MSKRFLLLCILQAIMFGVIGYALYSYAIIAQEQEFLTILAPIKGADPHRVFAQFIATQTLHWDVPAKITKLIIPMYIPSPAQQIKILLYQNNQLLTWWKYPSEQEIPTAPISRDVSLAFVAPMELSGDIKVVFDGSAIEYDNQGSAPGFFVEEQDTNYPNGNYSIASNEKSGDIGMQFISEETGWQLFWRQFHREPLGTASMLLIFGSGLLLLSYMPILCVRLGGALVSKIRK